MKIEAIAATFHAVSREQQADDLKVLSNLKGTINIGRKSGSLYPYEANALESYRKQVIKDLEFS